MGYFDRGKYIFSQLKIKDPLSTIIHNYNGYTMTTDYNKYFAGKISNQKAGGKIKDDIYLTYKNKKYLFAKTHDGDFLYYALHENENEDEPICIMIIVEKDINNCSIQTLSYNEKCFNTKDQLQFKSTGSDLLKIALKFIDKIKDKYNIKTITLTDNSKKYCTTKKQIRLGLMLTLLTGDTWYGKYGFRPKEKTMQKAYEKNKKIIEELRLPKIPFFKNMIEKILKTYYGKEKDVYDPIIETLEEYYSANKRLFKFLSYFLAHYEHLCETFFDFYEELARKIGITDFYGVDFIKYL